LGAHRWCCGEGVSGLCHGHGISLDASGAHHAQESLEVCVGSVAVKSVCVMFWGAFALLTFIEMCEKALDLKEVKRALRLSPVPDPYSEHMYLHSS